MLYDIIIKSYFYNFIFKINILWFKNTEFLDICLKRGCLFRLWLTAWISLVVLIEMAL